MLPLDGVTVLSLEQAVAAPLATRQLADYGARVIKVERPGEGDFARHYDAVVKGLSSHFVWLNRSKESLALDVRELSGQTVVRRLLEQADVFVQNLAPGAVERLGLAPAELRKRLPRLITCSISGYGSSGPYSDRKAYDLLVQCETGVLAITGTSETPCKVGVAVADIAAGMFAAQGILLALRQRDRTGVGSHIETSLFDGLAEWMGFPAYFTAFGGTAPPRSGAAHATIAPYGPFRVGDGGTVFLAVQNESEWVRLCQSLLGEELAGHPMFATNGRRVANRDRLQELIEQRFAKERTEDLMDRLNEIQIACGRLNDVPEFLDHPQLRLRDRWREVESPSGPLRLMLPPLLIEGMEPVMGRIPAVGEHNGPILQELGLEAGGSGAVREEPLEL
jgi:itaconate CoA-transferase